MKKERLFQVIGMIEDDLIKEAEDEQIAEKKLFSIGALWKWTAAAAGILLIAGIGIWQKNWNKNCSNTSSFNGSALMSTTAAVSMDKTLEKKEEICEEEEVAAGAENGWLDTADENLQAYAETAADGYQEEISRVSLYAKIIEEIYQPYQGYPLYLNLEDEGNLSEEQREMLLEVLKSEYQIVTVTGSFEELSKQGVIDVDAEEIFGIYLSFQVTEEQENGFAFQIDCWGGRNVRFGWQNGNAHYDRDGWRYELK